MDWMRTDRRGRARPRPASRSATAALGDLGGYIGRLRRLGWGDLSLLVKCGVQFGLWGGAVQHLGTERHHEAYLRGISTIRLPGCFAMTDSATDPTCRACGTTASYDPDRRVRDRHSRRRRAQGVDRQRRARRAHGRRVRATHRGRRGARRARAGGAHPRRGRSTLSMPGVRIEDCGSKLGLDGVDNGRLWFDAACASRARRCWTATPP